MHIKTIHPHEATGLLKHEYDAARQRAGHVWNIVKSRSLNANTLRASMQVIAYFNYINRLANALGVEPDEGLEEFEEELNVRIC